MRFTSSPSSPSVTTVKLGLVGDSTIRRWDGWDSACWALLLSYSQAKGRALRPSSQPVGKLVLCWHVSAYEKQQGHQLHKCPSPHSVLVLSMMAEKTTGMHPSQTIFKSDDPFESKKRGPQDPLAIRPSTHSAMCRAGGPFPPRAPAGRTLAAASASLAASACFAASTILLCSSVSFLNLSSIEVLSSPNLASNCRAAQVGRSVNALGDPALVSHVGKAI